MTTNLAKVKKKMNIYAKRRVRNVLTGNYGSVFKGRGMDFDDLRVYQYGDDIKDIDWKASARSRSPMIRRYVAIRKHNILIVADSGRNMTALTPSGETKIEIANFAAGIIAYIAHKNSDLVGIVFGNESGNTRFPLKEGEAHIENFLNKYKKSVSETSDKANLDALLSYISKNFRERMFLIVISDPTNVSSISPTILKKIRARHEQMVIMIDDSSLTNSAIIDSDTRDIVDNLRLPAYIRKNHNLREAEEKLRKNLKDDVVHDLKRFGICSCIIESSDNAVPAIFKMLEEQKHVHK